MFSASICAIREDERGDGVDAREVMDDDESARVNDEMSRWCWKGGERGEWLERCSCSCISS